MTGNWNVLAFLSKVLVVSTCSNLERETEKYALHLPHFLGHQLSLPPPPPSRKSSFFWVVCFYDEMKMFILI
jgi:hypothetical protein